MESLCRDRSLETHEHFAPNAFYGLDQILKLYAGLPYRQPVPAVLPHGLFLDPGFVWRAERRAALPAVLVPEQHRRALYEAATNKVVLPAASPYLYLLDMIPRGPQQRTGTLFFPSHSTHYVTSDTDFEMLAHSLLGLPEHQQPVTVCMYWRDVHLGHHEPFQRLGHPIVSAGHIYDPAFLLRLHSLLASHEFAAGNDFGSHMIYAVASGCKYFHVGDRAALTVPSLLAPRSSLDEAPWIAPDYATVTPLYRALIRAFGTHDVDSYAEGLQSSLAKYFLGQANFLTPPALRALILNLVALDEWGSLVARSSGAYTQPLPPRARRLARKARARCERAFGITSRGA